MSNVPVWPSKLVVRIVLGFLLLISGALPSRAQAVQIEIVRLGIYSNEANSRTGTPPTFLESTAVIPAELGREFGFEFIQVGAEAGNVLDLTLVTEFPSQGTYDTDTQKTIFRDQRSIRSVGGRLGYQGYVLDSPAELVLGTWTFKILYEDQLLASQSFTLVSP